MKVVILAGGLGSRLLSSSRSLPKPMNKIGNIPIIIHIMDIYSKYNYNEFIIALGFKGNTIKKYFEKYKIVSNDTGNINKYKIKKKIFIITFVDTGSSTMTGGRLKRLKKYLNKERFFLTYGDGLSNVNIKKLLTFHIKQNTIGTVTAVHPPARFGELILNKNKVISFQEKVQTKNDWINGGFFVFEFEFIKYIKDDTTVLEELPLSLLSKNRELSSFKHNGFWKCMDTKRDKDELNNMYYQNETPWKVNE
ncbi:sugar phosphate nucleotidyltransferase [Pelagibacteraceae bacterium]|nr:sugar phosphate nucleotidyltransferase [Pelagibacteraceae bacterium]